MVNNHERRTPAEFQETGATPVALDPRTLKVVYLEPFFVRDEGNTNAFLEHLVEAYGE